MKAQSGISVARLLMSVPVVASSTAFIGCDDPLVDPAVIVDERVIAVRLEAGDGSRAQPEPGERFTAKVFVVAPEPRPVFVALRACAALPTTLGVPRCDGDVFDAADTAGETTAPIELELTLDEALSEGDEWLLLGATCRDGMPEYSSDEAAFECAEDAPKEFFLRTMVSSGDANHNPELSDDELRYDGSLWEPALDAPPPGEPCAEAMLPRLGVGENIAIEFRMREDDRERLAVDPDEYGANAREGLLFTHMATEPGVARPFSSITPTDTSTSFEVELKLDADLDVPRAGRTGVFYLVVRDDRGGSDVLGRAFCALP